MLTTIDGKHTIDLDSAVKEVRHSVERKSYLIANDEARDRDVLKYLKSVLGIQVLCNAMCIPITQQGRVKGMVILGNQLMPNQKTRCFFPFSI